MIYYISDLHFGHQNVIAMDGRPFETIEEMDATLIRLWNERVTDEDDVYIVGDFAYRNGNTASWYLRQLKGRKHLIIGNHDRHTIQDPKAMECFASVEKMACVMDNDRVVSLLRSGTASVGAATMSTDTFMSAGTRFMSLCPGSIRH